MRRLSRKLVRCVPEDVAEVDFRMHYCEDGIFKDYLIIYRGKRMNGKNFEGDILVGTWSSWFFDFRERCLDTVLEAYTYFAARGIKARVAA